MHTLFELLVRTSDTIRDAKIASKPGHKPLHHGNKSRQNKLPFSFCEKFPSRVPCDQTERRSNDAGSFPNGEILTGSIKQLFSFHTMLVMISQSVRVKSWQARTKQSKTNQTNTKGDTEILKDWHHNITPLHISPRDAPH